MKQAISNVMKFFKTLLKNQPKEESLTIIIRPLNGIEEKITIRQTILKDKIKTLEGKKCIIKSLIEDHEKEIKRCDQYLNNINNFT